MLGLVMSGQLGEANRRCAKDLKRAVESKGRENEEQI